MASKIESKCRSGAEYSLSQSSLSITNQNKDYNSNKRIALFTSSSYLPFCHYEKGGLKTQLMDLETPLIVSYILVLCQLNVLFTLKIDHYGSRQDLGKLNLCKGKAIIIEAVQHFVSQVTMFTEFSFVLI